MTAKEFIAKDLESKFGVDVAVHNEWYTGEEWIEQMELYHQAKLKLLGIADFVAMLPTEKEVDEWFTYRSENPPHTNIKVVRAIEGANKYRAIMLQRLEKLQGN